MSDTVTEKFQVTRIQLQFEHRDLWTLSGLDGWYSATTTYSTKTYRKRLFCRSDKHSIVLYFLKWVLPVGVVGLVVWLSSYVRCLLNLQPSTPTTTAGVSAQAWHYTGTTLSVLKYCGVRMNTNIFQLCESLGWQTPWQVNQYLVHFCFVLFCFFPPLKAFLWHLLLLF